MNIKHRVGEMKKTRNPNENRRGKTGQYIQRAVAAVRV